MPLYEIEKLGFTHQGKSYTAQRLIYRVGSSNRLAQVVDFEGRQVVDDSLYKEKDGGLMRRAAKDLLLSCLAPRVGI